MTDPPILIEIPTHADPRGTLRVIEYPLRRVFWTSDVTGMRGDHSHLSCFQILIPIKGATIIVTSNAGFDKREFILAPIHNKALLVPPGNCISYTTIDPDGIVLVLCTEEYWEDIIIPCSPEAIDDG